MNSLLKYTTLLLAVFFVTAFSTNLSAKTHCSTSFSLSFINTCLRPAPPVYREYHYVDRTPVYYAPAPVYRERIYAPRPAYREYYVERPAYRETVVVERSPYYDWRY